MAKKWYRSKTMWANAAALVVAFGAWMQGADLSVVFPAILAVANMALRIVTKQPVE